MGKIIIGAILIFLQVLSYIGNLATGGVKFFTTLSMYEVVYFLSFNFFGIIGLIILIFGIYSLKKQK